MDEVYAVHAVRPDEICATDVVWTAMDKADLWAAEVSNDPEVLAGAVTRYVLDTPGMRTPVSLFVKGQRQEVAHLSDDRRVAANGWIRSRSLWETRNGKTWKVDTSE